MQYKYLWGTAFIVVGLFLAFLGRKLFTVAVFVVATIIVAGVILVIFYSTFLSDKTAAWVSWLVVSISIVIGIVAGFFATKVEKFGAAILAGWGGFCIGVLLNETVLYLFASKIVFWCVNIGLALICGVIALYAFNPAVIFFTALVGSYFTMRGVGLYAGHFTNEYVLINQI